MISANILDHFSAIEDPPLFMFIFWSMLSFPFVFFCSLRAGFKSIAVVAGLEDVAAVRKTIQKLGRHLCISEDQGPSLTNGRSRAGRIAPTSVITPLPKHRLQRRGIQHPIHPTIQLLNAARRYLCDHRLGQGAKPLDQQPH